MVLDLVSCGNGMLSDIDSLLPNIVSTLVNLVKVAVPIILIVFGMLDLGKAVAAQKEDEIKKGQALFVKRLIAAAIVFFVFFIVQIVFNLVAPKNDTSNGNIWNCVNCFVNNKCTVQQ